MLQLTRKKKTGPVVGLDIEAGSIAAAEVHSNGSAKLAGAAIEPLAPGAFHEGEVVDSDTLVETLKSLFAAHKLSKRVRLGIGNQRVVVRTMRLPAIEDPNEMETAVRFQAQEHIPMPLDEAVLEHQVVGGVPAEEGTAPQVDVMVVAARRETIRSFTEPIRRAGLDPVGVDLSAFGMIRALGDTPQPPTAQPAEVAAADGAQRGESQAVGGGAVLYCNLGDVMNLAVARGPACLFTRVSTAGLEGMVARLGAERGLTAEHSLQWLTYVGIERAVNELDGDPDTVAAARRVLEDGVSGLVDELRLSLDYYAAQEAAVPVSQVVLCGPGSAIGGLPDRVREGLGVEMTVARPLALASFDESAAARLTLPYGLALGG